MTISKLVLHVKADIIYRLKNDIMEDCFYSFVVLTKQFLSSALTQQFNSLTRLGFFLEYFLTTFNALIISSILISAHRFC